MAEVTRERLLALPKAELHAHLDGSLRPATLLELARQSGRALPHRDAQALADYMAEEVGDLPAYLERFQLTLPVMQRPEALERIAYEMGEDAAAENVRYLEVRYSPILHTQEGLSLEEVVDATVRGVRRAQAEQPIRIGLVLCGIRNLSPKLSKALAEVAVAYRDRGVVGFDLAGPERDNPPAEHQLAFDLVAEANMAVTIHAGEASGPASIHQALHRCHARRIGHGTRLFEDPDLEAYVNDFRIPLEVCPTSNVQTRAVASLSQHPLRRYFDEGLVVTLNTDSRLMSSTTLTEEYWRCHQQLGFTWEELVDIALMGFQSAFLPWSEKVALVQDVTAEIAAL